MLQKKKKKSNKNPIVTKVPEMFYTFNKMKVVLKTPSLSEQALLNYIFNRFKEMPSGNLLVIWGTFSMVKVTPHP